MEKEWNNFGRDESRTNGWESKSTKIQIKLAATCNKNNNNRMPKVLPNYRTNRWQLGRTLKSVLDEAVTGILMSNSWHDDGDCDDVTFLPER